MFLLVWCELGKRDVGPNWGHWMTRSQVTGWNPLEGSTKSSCGKLRLGGMLPASNSRKGVEGRVGSPGIRLGRGTSRSSLNLHPKTNHKGLISIREHPWVLGQATGIWTHLTHHGPDSGEATTFPPIVFSAAFRRDYIQMALFPGTPKLESRNCPEIVPVGVPGLWELITPDCRVGSRRGLNQSCSPRWDLFNDMLHSQIECREEVDSRLLVVRSQTTSLTPALFFCP
jgi:hypothetical protein